MLNASGSVVSISDQESGVATVARGCIDGAAMDLEDTRQPTQCPVAREMALAVIYSLQPIQIQ